MVRAEKRGNRVRAIDVLSYELVQDQSHNRKVKHSSSSRGKDPSAASRPDPPIRVADDPPANEFSSTDAQDDRQLRAETGQIRDDRQIRDDTELGDDTELRVETGRTVNSPTTKEKNRLRNLLGSRGKSPQTQMQIQTQTLTAVTTSERKTREPPNGRQSSSHKVSNSPISKQETQTTSATKNRSGSNTKQTAKLSSPSSKPSRSAKDTDRKSPRLSASPRNEKHGSKAEAVYLAKPNLTQTVLFAPSPRSPRRTLLHRFRESGSIQKSPQAATSPRTRSDESDEKQPSMPRLQIEKPRARGQKTNTSTDESPVRSDKGQDTKLASPSPESPRKVKDTMKTSTDENPVSSSKGKDTKLASPSPESSRKLKDAKKNSTDECPVSSGKGQDTKTTSPSPESSRKLKDAKKNSTDECPMSSGKGQDTKTASPFPESSRKVKDTKKVWGNELTQKLFRSPLDIRAPSTGKKELTSQPRGTYDETGEKPSKGQQESRERPESGGNAQNIALECLTPKSSPRGKLHRFKEGEMIHKSLMNPMLLSSPCNIRKAQVETQTPGSPRHDSGSKVEEAAVNPKANNDGDLDNVSLTIGMAPVPTSLRRATQSPITTALEGRDQPEDLQQWERIDREDRITEKGKINTVRNNDRGGDDCQENSDLVETTVDHQDRVPRSKVTSDERLRQVNSSFGDGTKKDKYHPVETALQDKYYLEDVTSREGQNIGEVISFVSSQDSYVTTDSTRVEVERIKRDLELFSFDGLKRRFLPASQPTLDRKETTQRIEAKKVVDDFSEESAHDTRHIDTNSLVQVFSEESAHAEHGRFMGCMMFNVEDAASLDSASDDEYEYENDPRQRENIEKVDETTRDTMNISSNVTSLSGSSGSYSNDIKPSLNPSEEAVRRNDSDGITTFSGDEEVRLTRHQCDDEDNSSYECSGSSSSVSGQGSMTEWYGASSDFQSSNSSAWF